MMDHGPEANALGRRDDGDYQQEGNERQQTILVVDSMTNMEAMDWRLRQELQLEAKREKEREQQRLAEWERSLSQVDSPERSGDTDDSPTSKPNKDNDWRMPKGPHTLYGPATKATRNKTGREEHKIPTNDSAGQDEELAQGSSHSVASSHSARSTQSYQRQLQQQFQQQQQSQPPLQRRVQSRSPMTGGRRALAMSALSNEFSMMSLPGFDERHNHRRGRSKLLSQSASVIAPVPIQEPQIHRATSVPTFVPPSPLVEPPKEPPQLLHRAPSVLSHNLVPPPSEPDICIPPTRNLVRSNAESRLCSSHPSNVVVQEEGATMNNSARTHPMGNSTRISREERILRGGVSSRSVPARSDEAPYGRKASRGDPQPRINARPPQLPRTSPTRSSPVAAPYGRRISNGEAKARSPTRPSPTNGAMSSSYRRVPSNGSVHLSALGLNVQRGLSRRALGDSAVLSGDAAVVQCSSVESQAATVPMGIIRAGGDMLEVHDEEDMLQQAMELSRQQDQGQRSQQLSTAPDVPLMDDDEALQLVLELSRQEQLHHQQQLHQHHQPPPQPIRDIEVLSHFDSCSSLGDSIMSMNYMGESFVNDVAVLGGISEISENVSGPSSRPFPEVSSSGHCGTSQHNFQHPGSSLAPTLTQSNQEGQYDEYEHVKECNLKPKSTPDDLTPVALFPATTPALMIQQDDDDNESICSDELEAIAMAMALSQQMT